MNNLICQTFRKLIFWTFLLYALSSGASELVVEGTALIERGDLGQARELATRRALAKATELKGAHVSAASIVRPEAVYDTVQVKSSACTENSEQLSERVNGNELTIVLRVSLGNGPECTPTCRGTYTNKLLVTGFAMEFPEQKLVSELPRLSHLTAGELARKIRHNRRLLVDFKSDAFPYLTPARAPEPYIPQHGTETFFATLGKNHRAQYVLSGVYRDFGIKGLLPFLQIPFKETRRIEMEAFIHDAINGEMLVRKTFAKEAYGSVRLNSSPSVGSDAFYRGDLGKAWGEILEEIAAWADLQTVCLPLSSRVISVSGKTLHIDSGAESGLSVGDTLNLHTWKEAPVMSMAGTFLGQEKRLRATATIRVVYPKFSVIEISDFPKGLIVKPGDILYVN